MQISKKLAIIATSLNAESRSQLLGQCALEAAQRLKLPVTFLDLRSFSLPFCGTAAAWADKESARLEEALKDASHIIFASPIYNYQVNAAAKNVVELLGDDIFGGKTIAFLCAAGGKSSYMSVLSFANSLMLDFRCWILPRFVYATGEDFGDGVISNPEVRKRVEELVDDLMAHEVAPPKKK